MKLITVYVVINKNFVKVSKDLNEAILSLFLVEGSQEILQLARQNETDLKVIRSHIKNDSKILESMCK